MVYEFKSRAAGNLITTQDVAEKILDIIGKPHGNPGIITVEQMPAAISALEQAVANAKAEDAAGGAERKDADGKAVITLGQRAYPFIEMLKICLAAGKEITWGV